MIRRFTRPALFAVLLPGLAAALPVAAFAQTAEPAPETRSVTVTGEGEATVAPDMAIVNLSVLREAATAREALDANNEAMERVLAAMREAGVADRDLQTSGFAVVPQYLYPQDGNDAQGPRITGYQVTNTLSVRLRDLDRLGEILDQSISLGVNQGGDIIFTNDDPDATLERARREAVADAVARAETLTEAAGVTLGEVLRIDETSHVPPPMPLARAEMAKSFAADASVPVATGENAYHVTVTMEFELGAAASEQ